MDVRTICLGILTRGDATGYEIKKLFEEDGYQHFVEASFGSIYPALSRLTEQGYVSVREESQEKRPDRKVYVLTAAGQQRVAGWLAEVSWPRPDLAEFHLKLIAASTAGLASPTTTRTACSSPSSGLAIRTTQLVSDSVSRCPAG